MCVLKLAELTFLDIFDRSDVVSFIGSFVIGVLGNLYSRVFQGTAFTAMVTGVLFLVPSGVSAAGGLAMSYNSGGDSYSNGLTIGFRMVQVAIGITVGRACSAARRSSSPRSLPLLLRGLLSLDSEYQAHKFPKQRPASVMANGQRHGLVNRSWPSF